MLIVILFGIVTLAFWQRTPVLKLIAGVVSIAFGIYWIDVGAGWDILYIIEGMAACFIGFYLLITTAMDLLKGGR